MTPSHADILSVMKPAARGAMDYLGGEFRALSLGESAAGLGVASKANKANLPDFVTRLDIEAENRIRDMLAAAFPDIPFVGEEAGGDMTPRRFFLVDPLDGTKNMMALRDNFAVCIAYVEDGEVKAAVIGDPVRGDIISAVKGGGAWLEDAQGKAKTLKASGTPDLKQVQLDAELGFTDPEDFAMLARVMPQVSTLRKSGSIAFDFMRLAQNRPEAVVGTGLEPHDIAAGLLILREAGMTVTDFEGGQAGIRTRSLFAAAPDVHRRLIGAIGGKKP
jgi:myo-inositol-1(or 4)-monophosphatase